MSPPGVDPSNINEDNIPQILAAILVVLEKNREEHAEIKEMLKCHEEYLQVLKFSKCTFFPWLSRNGWTLTLLLAFFSLWISSLDWINRWLQWSLFPPK